MVEQTLREPAAQRDVASILLVDDRPANLIALEAILEPLGHRLVKANSGEEALKRLLLGDFAAILMDVQMPGLDGFQTAALIKERERTRHIPILFLTAINKDAAYVFRGYEHGAVDYLLKPFDPTVLRAKVSVFVELWLRGERLKRQEALLREAQKETFERQAETRFRSVVDAMSHCVWVLGADGKASYVNAKARVFSGGQVPLLDSLHPEDREEVGALLKRSLAAGQPFECECRLRRADGEYRWHLGRAVPGRDEKNAILDWVLTFTDIHEVKEAREEAEKANRAKDEFLATVSHELRNPLNAILGWLRMLRSGRLDEGREEKALEIIQRNTEAQLELVEDILDVSRITTGKLRIAPQPVRLQSVVQAACDTVRPAADAKKIRLEVVSDPDAQAVTGDPDRLQQVAWNLLSNAIKFTPRGGTVEVRLERADSYVRLRVTDSGRGIAPDFLPHVFEPFRQADQISTRAQGGLGLGLAIVKRLVEAHGGTIGVDSPGEGKGATFVVQLPLRAILPSEERTSGERITQPLKPLDEAPSLDAIRVLVVDDEPDARELLQIVLEEFGAEVQAVGSCREAVEALSREPFDVLVSDVGLPQEDGYTLIHKVRTAEHAQARIPAAALTGFARAEDGQRALQAGFQVHLAKPVEPARLVSVVAELAAAAPTRAIAS